MNEPKGGQPERAAREAGAPHPSRGRGGRDESDNWKEVQKRSVAALPVEVVKFIRKVSREERGRSQLIAVLHQVQAHYGHLAQPQLEAVAQLLQVPAAKVSGVASFYHFFRTVPKGRHMLSICLGTACYVKGAAELVERVQRELGIRVGETTEDGLFSLVDTRCVGTCGLAPVVLIDDQIHGRVTPDQLVAEIDRLARQRD